MPTTVAAAIGQARRRGIARLDAQLMLARLLGTTRTALIAHDDRPLPADLVARWGDWLERRAGGEPLAYLLGDKEFHGLRLAVTPDVLVPRAETELLVDWAAEILRCTAGQPRVVDLGTGSGAIALAIKHGHPSAEVLATDLSPAALAVARRNADRLALAVEFVESSWWQGLAGRRFDLAVANPPYVAEGDPALRQLRHEPRTALTPGGDGLAALADVVAGAAAHLEPGGWLLLEHGFDQAGPVRGLLDASGFSAIESRSDLAGHVRATGGRSPPSLP
jgi:release factor glutamine methyltransferase